MLMLKRRWWTSTCPQVISPRYCVRKRRPCDISLSADVFVFRNASNHFRNGTLFMLHLLHEDQSLHHVQHISNSSPGMAQPTVTDIHALSASVTPLECFKQFVPQECFELIVNPSNLIANISNRSAAMASRMSSLKARQVYAVPRCHPQDVGADADNVCANTRPEKHGSQL